MSMKTFCVYYPSKYEGTNREYTEEFWTTASTEEAAMTIFKEEAAKGNLDFPCIDISRARVENKDY